MLLDAIDTLFADCDLADVVPTYKRLGLRLTTGPNKARFAVGSKPARVTVGLDPGSGGPGLSSVGLRVADVNAAASTLETLGVVVLPSIRPLPAAAWIPDSAAGVDLMLLPSSIEDRSATDAENAFPLRRLDHLASVAHDLESTSRFWTDVLRVPVFGEVVTPTMIIRQFKVGDAIIELLGPASPDSPIHKRPPGLVSMAAWEVTDLAAAVAQARAAGFTVPDPATGVLPGTRTATIPAAELGGLAMQLLEYA